MTDTKRVCFYHSADLDGFCSGAIVATHFDWDVKLIPIDYGYPVPWEEIDKDTEVWMIDFKLPMEDMATINETVKRFIWVDHHKTAIDEYDKCLEAGGIGEIEGVREVGKAACELLWDYLHPMSDNMPKAVYYLGRFDVWAWEEVENALEFQMGMRAIENMNPLVAQKYREETDYEADDYDDEVDPSVKWDLLLHNTTSGHIHHINQLVADIIRDGKAIIRYRTKQLAMESKGSCFLTVFAGMYVIAANVGYTNSQFFDSVLDAFPWAKALITFHYRNNRWNLSLYQIKGRDTPDLGKIAKKYGGGGHPGAAGFKLPPGGIEILLRPPEQERRIADKAKEKSGK